MTYQVGETPRLIATITDLGGVATDPSSVKININKPDGVAAVESASMAKDATGSYYYDYLLPIDVLGTYRYNVTATGSTGRKTIVKDSFLVEGAF